MACNTTRRGTTKVNTTESVQQREVKIGARELKAALIGKSIGDTLIVGWEGNKVRIIKGVRHVSPEAAAAWQAAYLRRTAEDANAAETGISFLPGTLLSEAQSRELIAAYLRA